MTQQKYCKLGQIWKEAAITITFCVCHFFCKGDINMDEKYMKKALKQAAKAFGKGDVPVGAVIVKNGKVIATAYNKKEETKDVTDHAEIIAIRKACKALDDWRLNDCQMYVTLEPCPMCMGAIEQARITRLVYGAKIEKQPIDSNLQIVNQVLGEECAKLLKTFFQNQRNV